VLCILVIVLLGLPFGALLAQAPQEVRHHSPLEGTPVLHPESLSGLWEAPDGQGGAGEEALRDYASELVIPPAVIMVRKRTVRLVRPSPRALLRLAMEPV
jgi:hypothetical protein